jgi:large conductance mechanosensitive channel
MMLKEFKEFAVKGNVVDMAVGVIVGAAFAALVKSLVYDVLMPPLSLLAGGLDFAEKFVVLKDGTTAGPYDSLAHARESGATVLSYGQFINTAITFLLIALALFFVVKWINRLRRPDTPPAPSTRSCPYCKSIIDVTAERCAYCTSDIEPVNSGKVE